MSRRNGSWPNDYKKWDSYCEYSVSSTSTTTTLTVSAVGFHSYTWGFDLSSVTAHLGATGQSAQSASGAVSIGTGVSKDVPILTSKSYSWTRGHSAATKTVTFDVVNSTGYMDGTSSSSFAVTVPAKPSYTVSYSANGGSGAPASQTKWYGETLKLSTTKPTRTGYTFLGWATSSSATSASVQPGASYTANSGQTYYAVWKVAYTAPKITGASIQRCTSGGTLDDEGTYAKLAFTWSADTTDSGTMSSLKVQTKAASASSWGTATTLATSGTSGTVDSVLGTFEVTSTYKALITATDSHGLTTTKTLTLSPSFYTMDFLSGGKGVAFGKAATDEGFTLAMDMLDLNGLQVFEPYTANGHVSVGYGPYSQSTGRLNLYGNEVNVSSKGNLWLTAQSVTISAPAAWRTAIGSGNSKVLWSGGSYMTDTQTATLTETVSSQLSGIVLAFSDYSSGAAHDYNWHYFFVPKGHVANKPGTGVNFQFSTLGFGTVGGKYLYIHDGSITGHADNDNTGTGLLTYHNERWVLRYVYGV